MTGPATGAPTGSAWRDGVPHVLRANGLLLLQYAVGALVPLALLPHVSRALGLAAYGEIAVALAFAGYGTLVVQYAFQYTGPCRLAQPQAGETPADVLVAVTRAKLLLCALASAGLIGGWVVHGGSGVGVRATAVALFVPVIAACLNSTWFLQAQACFGRACIAAIAASGTALAFGFWCVHPGGSESVAALALVAPGLLAGLFTFAFAWRLRGESGTRRTRARGLLREGGPLFLSQAVAAIYGLSGPIVVALAAGPAEAGAFSLVERMTAAVGGACLMTHTAAYPRLARWYATDRPAYRRLLGLVIGGYVAVTATAGVVAWIAREPLAAFAFGAAVAVPAPLLAWGLAYLVVGIAGPALSGYLAVSGRSRALVGINLGVLVATFAIGVPAALHAGAAGWMAALALGQSVQVLAGVHAWRTAAPRAPGTRIAGLAGSAR